MIDAKESVIINLKAMLRMMRTKECTNLNLKWINTQLEHIRRFAINNNIDLDECAKEAGINLYNGNVFSKIEKFTWFGNSEEQGLQFTYKDQNEK